MKNIPKYYTDPYQEILQTKIKHRREGNNPGQTWYEFEDSIFYPGGGGQSPDRGSVNEQQVIEIEVQNTAIWHLLAAELPLQVVQKLDWTHRYQNMKQHTGQHILSAVFFKHFGINTVSVHLGETETMVEFLTKQIEPEQLNDAETEANRIISNGLIVEDIWVDEQNADKYDLRRSVKKKGDQIRLIRIEGLDVVGCGGTHVKNTAEIGLIKITGTETIRGNCRVKALIGKPAYRYFESLHQTSQQIGQYFSSHFTEFPERINALLEEKKILGSQLKIYRDRWLEQLLEEFKNQKELVLHIFEGEEPQTLKKLSEKITKNIKLPCFLISRFEQKTFFIIRSTDALQFNASEFVKNNSKVLSLKGGGDKEFVQGIIIEQINRQYLKKVMDQFKNFVSSS